MNPNDPNVAMMEIVAERLGDELREQLVFIGGAVAGLLITDPGQPSIRPTEDVDLIVHAGVRADYQRPEFRLARIAQFDTGKNMPHDCSLHSSNGNFRPNSSAEQPSKQRR